MDKDTSYTAMDDLTPKRPTRDSDPRGPADDAYPASDPPEGPGGTGRSVTEDPSYERPLEPPSDEDDTSD